MDLYASAIIASFGLYMLLPSRSSIDLLTYILTHRS
jgi:hypothetical protein